MKPNPYSMEALCHFFKINEGLTNNQLAIKAEVSPWTIVDWKRKCGVVKSTYKKPPLKAKGPIPKNWDNKEWFVQAYEKMGLRAIALLIGKGNNWHFVARRFKKHGIKRRSHAERTASVNPCCDEGWLHYYYADRETYLSWCRRNYIKSCPKGGQKLSAVKCAKLADVTHWTINNWLVTYKMRARTNSEAQINCKFRKKTDAERRVARDIFFECYRNGSVNIMVGSRRFSNGTELDKAQIINKRFNKEIRGASKRPKDSP